MYKGSAVVFKPQGPEGPWSSSVSPGKNIRYCGKIFFTKLLNSITALRGWWV